MMKNQISTIGALYHVVTDGVLTQLEVLTTAVARNASFPMVKSTMRTVLVVSTMLLGATAYEAILHSYMYLSTHWFWNSYVCSYGHSYGYPLNFTGFGTTSIDPASFVKTLETRREIRTASKNLRFAKELADKWQKPF